MPAPELSFCVPCHNEEGNLPELIRQIEAAAARTGKTYEIVVTDDRSSDRSWEVLKGLAATRPHLRALRLDRNSGESAASYTAITAARGAIIVTIDGDLQNDPADLPKFLAALDGADCVCGTRQSSRDEGDSVLKTLTSKISNGIRSAVLGDAVTDAGCTYRAFKRECFTGIPFFKGVHRFMPIIMAFRGHKIVEVPITNRERSYGSSHYGFGLFSRKGAVADMIAMRWLKSRMIRFAVAERTFDPERPRD
ncbi:MAG TPA: glycosyltransferase family 2 protein [Alphaproteobacteria bacterium]